MKVFLPDSPGPGSFNNNNPKVACLKSKSAKMFGDGTDLIKHRKKVRACRNFICGKLAKPLSFLMVLGQPPPPIFPVC